MNSRPVILSLLGGIILLCSSCATSNMANFYTEHKTTLDSIRHSYLRQYRNSPFSIAFSNKNFNSFSLEIITDTIKYIYDFDVNDERLNDTLVKYRMSPEGIAFLVRSMQSLRCIWVNNLDYYVNGKKNSLIYMSIRPRAISLPFVYKKYQILAYFNQPQVFDENGRLLDGRRKKTIRKINNNTFRRITDTVCYTVSSLFR